MCWFFSYMFPRLCVSGVNTDLFYAKVVHVYDIYHIKLKLSYCIYMDCQLANICVPINLNNIYLNDVKEYLCNKTFQVKLLQDNKVHLYENGMYVNNFINNLLLYHLYMGN